MPKNDKSSESVSLPVIIGSITAIAICCISACSFITGLVLISLEKRKEDTEQVAGASTYSTHTTIPDTATVTDVIDGDTIEIYYNGTIEKVRLIGIDTPESKHPQKPVECFSKEATEKMKSLVEGKQVRIEFDESQDKRDKYDRLLLYIWQGDTFVNKEMILQGYAHEYTYRLPYKYQDEFKAAEKEAREHERGLWGDACE
ncbi:MAG: thermonuclease family protein [Candidatus Dojkabacteria bacterium]|nr:thermonuclease family protein [Candidatus Dojkabacteria bacterium]